MPVFASNGPANFVPYSFGPYADAAAREADTGFTAADIGKLARQLSNNSLWMLLAESPVTWIQIGGGGGPVKIGRVVVPASPAEGQALIEFLSIPQTYLDLEIIFSGRSMKAAALDIIGVRINGSTATNSQFLTMSTTGSGVTGTSGFTTGSSNLGEIPGNTAAGQLNGQMRILFPDYRNTSRNKTFMATTSRDSSSMSHVYGQYDQHGQTGGTPYPAITALAVKAAEGNLAPGSVATLWGFP